MRENVHRGRSGQGRLTVLRIDHVSFSGRQCANLFDRGTGELENESCCVLSAVRRDVRIGHRLTERGSDLGRQRSRRRLAIGHLDPCLMPGQLVCRVDLLLEMALQTQVQTRAPQCGQLKGRGAARLHDHKVTRRHVRQRPRGLRQHVARYARFRVGSLLAIPVAPLEPSGLGGQYFIISPSISYSNAQSPTCGLVENSRWIATLDGPVEMYVQASGHESVKAWAFSASVG